MKNTIIKYLLLFLFLFPISIFASAWIEYKEILNSFDLQKIQNAVESDYGVLCVIQPAECREIYDDWYNNSLASLKNSTEEMKFCLTNNPTEKSFYLAQKNYDTAKTNFNLAKSLYVDQAVGTLLNVSKKKIAGYAYDQMKMLYAKISDFRSIIELLEKHFIVYGEFTDFISGKEKLLFIGEEHTNHDQIIIQAQVILYLHTVLFDKVSVLVEVDSYLYDEVDITPGYVSEKILQAYVGRLLSFAGVQYDPKNFDYAAASLDSLLLGYLDSPYKEFEQNNKFIDYSFIDQRHNIITHGWDQPVSTESIVDAETTDFGMEIRNGSMVSIIDDIWRAKIDNNLVVVGGSDHFPLQLYLDYVAAAKKYISNPRLLDYCSSDKSVVDCRNKSTRGYEWLLSYDDFMLLATDLYGFEQKFGIVEAAAHNQFNIEHNSSYSLRASFQLFVGEKFIPKPVELIPKNSCESKNLE